MDYWFSILMEIKMYGKLYVAVTFRMDGQVAATAYSSELKVGKDAYELQKTLAEVGSLIKLIEIRPDNQCMLAQHVKLDK